MIELRKMYKRTMPFGGRWLQGQGSDAWALNTPPYPFQYLFNYTKMLIRIITIRINAEREVVIISLKGGQWSMAKGLTLLMIVWCQWWTWFGRSPNSSPLDQGINWERRTGLRYHFYLSAKGKSRDNFPHFDRSLLRPITGMLRHGIDYWGFTWFSVSITH